MREIFGRARQFRLLQWLKLTWLSTVLSSALIATSPEMLLGSEEIGTPAQWQVEKQEGQGKLLSLKGGKVLLVKGDPYEMGFQHGKLMAKEVTEDVQAYLHDWAIGKAGESLSSLGKIFDSLRPFIPQNYLDEMRGLADGSGVPLKEIHLLHATPSRFHCTGAAAFGKATADGRLYHTRSLDYSLDIGDRKTVQENAVVIIYQPSDGNAHAVLSFAGMIGCVSGMNEKGISIGEIGNACRDESYAGMPMVFLLREALRTCNDLESVIRFVREAPRTCGFTFVVGDGKIPSACALEVSHSRMAVGLPGDPKSNPPPHFPIADAIRRGNYFVDKEMAALQRDVYDPRISSPADWLGYSVMSSSLVENHGTLTDIKMIELLRKYPPEHPCLHQAVFCPSTLEFWVSNAVNPAEAKFAGAQNQPFYKYNLRKLTQGIPFEVEVAHPPAIAADQLPRPEAGTVTVAERKEFLTDEALSRFRLKRKSFDWVLTYDFATEGCFVADLSFPSEVETRWPAANTVFAEYYRPRVSGRVPGVIVLDILQGDFVVARGVARALAENGIAALPVHMPFFGRRRPRDDPGANMFSDSIPFTRDLMTQAVLDIRSAAHWLRTREEIDPQKVGIVGVSLGAVIGGLAIGVDNSFSKSALVLGGGDIAQLVWTSPETSELKEKLRQKDYTLERLREELHPVEPLTYARRIDPSTVIMINAKNDKTVINDCTVKFWERAGQPKIVWYNTSHMGMALYMNKVIEEIIAFVRE
jgi:isopenicillin-N N-acyltransferase-like protein